MLIISLMLSAEQAKIILIFRIIMIFTPDKFFIQSSAGELSLMSE